MLIRNAVFPRMLPFGNVGVEVPTVAVVGASQDCVQIRIVKRGGDARSVQGTGTNRSRTGYDTATNDGDDVMKTSHSGLNSPRDMETAKDIVSQISQSKKGPFARTDLRLRSFALFAAILHSRKPFSK